MEKDSWWHPNCHTYRWKQVSLYWLPGFKCGGTSKISMGKMAICKGLFKHHWDIKK